MNRRLFLLGLFCLGCFVQRDCNAQSVANNIGCSVEVTAATGDYQIKTAHPNWTLGGSLGTTMQGVAISAGQDGIGAYSEIRFEWQDDGRRVGSVRLYQKKPIVIFSVTFPEGLDHAPTPFPVLKKFPEKLLTFRYASNTHMKPPMFALDGKDPKKEYGGPFCLFNHQDDAMLFSPASNFMVAMISGDQATGIAGGLNRTLKSIPAGYTQQTILVIDHGIHHTWNVWGHALTDLYKKKRPANDADVGLKYLSYWTDNGAAYYYNYDITRGYANTLLDVKAHLDDIGVRVHSFQLDSWWYPKTFNSVEHSSSDKPKNPRLPAGTWNRYGELLTYTPSPDLFPQGLKAFQEKLGVPLITHSRWIDPTSPYRQNYKISGIAPVDPKWWDKIIGDIASWGVSTYEQDWNNYIYNLSPELSNTTWAGDAYMDGMAHACAAHGLTMQYCMILPRNLMQGGAKYSNLTTSRLSDDRFARDRWRNFIYGSQMASALGVWPWTDVFRSKETANMLLCDLSAGMVGLADPIGKENLDNIFHVARPDGTIVKPDEPLTPTDQTYIAEAEGKNLPLICATHSGDTQYVFVFTPKTAHDPKPAEFSPANLGMHGKVFIYDYFKGSGQLVNAEKKFSQPLNKDAWAYDVLCPVGKSTMALVGDLGLFTTCGRQRVTSVTQKTGELDISLDLVGNKNAITLGVYAPEKPTLNVKNGSGAVDYDPATGLARAKIVVDADTRRPVDEIIPLEVSFGLHP